MSDADKTTRVPCPPGPPSQDAYLRSIGIAVEPQNIPGLYRINGGRELTYGQMLGVLGSMVMERDAKCLTSPKPPTHFTRFT